MRNVWYPEHTLHFHLFSVFFFFFSRNHRSTFGRGGGEASRRGREETLANTCCPNAKKTPFFFSFGCTFELVEVLLVDAVAAVAGHDGAGGAVAATAVVGQAVGAVGGAVLVGGGGGDQLGAVVLLLDGAGAALVLGGRGGLLLHRGHLAAGAAAAAAVHGGAAAAVVVPLLLDGARGRHPLFRSCRRCLPEVFLCRRRCGSAVVPSQRLRLGLEPEAVPVVAAGRVRHDARARFEWALNVQGGTKIILFVTFSPIPLHLGALSALVLEAAVGHW